MAKTLPLLLIYFFFCTFSLQAQDLEVWSDDSEIACPLGSTVENVVYIRNKSEKPITIKVKRTAEKLAKYQETFFRLDGKTVASRINESKNSVTIQPNETYSDFISVFSSGFKEGASTVSYRIYNEDKRSENVEITIRYVVSSEVPSDKLYVNEQISISFMYPNPAVQYGEFQYKMPDNPKKKAKISLHNILGKPLGKFDLDPRETTLRIQFKDWEPGIYF